MDCNNKRVRSAASLATLATGENAAMAGELNSAPIFTPARGRVVRPKDAQLLSVRQGEQTFRSTLNPRTFGTDAVSGGWYRLAKGVTNHLDMHPDRDEFYFVHRGRALLVLDGEPLRIEAGDTAIVPHGVEHQIINDAAEDLELFYLFAPAAPPYPARNPARYPILTFEPVDG